MLDEAGAGKSVVMRDVATALRLAGGSVLAIKADLQLTGVTSAEDIQARLQLPESLERTVDRLAARAGVVIVIDQLDALSLSMAQDRRTLEVVIDAIVRLTRIRRTRVIASCRTFDWNNDPRLRQLETRKDFRIGVLTDEELNRALAGAGLGALELTQTTRTLLRLPLHLDLFLLAHADTQPATLQDLYSSVLDERALRRGKDTPPATIRAQTLKVLTAAMFARQQTVVPATFFLDKGGDDMQAAAEWLASEGILLRSNSGWAFRHQTLFDYLFAKEFVDSGRSLAEFLRDGPQGLSSRSALVQVLGYQRATDPQRYMSQLDAIWRGKDIRFHLRHLLMRWFGTLPNPTAAETAWARRLLASANDRERFLRAASRNAAWFKVLSSELERLLEDETAVDQVLWFVAHMPAECQAATIAMIRPYLNRGGIWRDRCRFVLEWIRQWVDPRAIDFFDEVMQAGADLPQHFHGFQEMARLDANRTAVAVLHLVDARLQGALSRDDAQHRDVVAELRDLSGTDLQQAMDIIATNAPLTWADGLVTWLQRAAEVTTFGGDNAGLFALDAIAMWYEGSPGGIEASLLRSLGRALVVLGEGQPDEFRRVIDRLADTPYATPQMIAATAYSKLHATYAEEALAFLLGDRRRMWLGTASALQTRRLIQSIYPHLSPKQRGTLDAGIMSHTEWKSSDPSIARRAGLERYYLLSSIPEDLRSVPVQKYWAELNRKFPGVDTSLKAGRVRAFSEHSPIKPAAAAKMRNEDWLRAMQKHTQASTQGSPDLRSARSLADLLKEEVKKDPKRFAALSATIPNDTDDVYVAAFLDGFAEANVRIDVIATLVRRFAPDQSRDLRRSVAWVLRKRAAEVPEDLLNLLESWIRNDAFDDRYARETLDYLNTDRGSAFLAMMTCLHEQPSQGHEQRRWGLLEYIAASGTPLLRAAAIEQLLYELAENGERALALFHQLVAESSAPLFDAHHLSDFLHACIWQTFSQVRPMISDLIASSEEKHQEVGARLIALAAISPAALTAEELSLARDAVDMLLEKGSQAHKKTLAHVLAYNVDAPDAADYCFDQVRRVFSDPDAKVREEVSVAFDQMSEADIAERFDFLSEFTRSPALAQCLRRFARYLLDHGMAATDQSLTLIEQSLQNAHHDGDARWFDGEEFIRLVLRMETDPTSGPALRTRAIDVFDQLMERYGDFADEVLNEWDRR